MNKKPTSVKKQTASTDAAAKEANTNTNNTPAEQVEQVEQVETLCTINGKELHVGDTFRLNVDTTHGTAFIDINPTDDTPGRDDCAAWREDVRECYKQLQLACKGLIVEASYYNDKREQVTTRGTICGCGRDTNNNRCTFKLKREDGTDTTPSCKYVWKVYGFNADYSGNGNRNTDNTPTAARTLASIQADIDKWEARAREATDKANKYKEERRKALEVEITAVKTTLELHPTTREVLVLCANVPTADRIPDTERTERNEELATRAAILEPITDQPAVVAAIKSTWVKPDKDWKRRLVAEYSEEAFEIFDTLTAEEISNADKVLSLMKEKGLGVDDIPTDILP